MGNDRISKVEMAKVAVKVNLEFRVFSSTGELRVKRRNFTLG